MDKLKVAANFIKSKFQTDELDQKLAEAVSEENWQASTQLLHEISNASFNFENQQRISTFIWEKLKSKNWKKVLKTLHLIDFLIKYGPTSLIDNFKENVYDFRRLDDYTCQADGIDRGESVRKQAKVVLLLLTDDQQLHDERAKAKQIKERMSSVIGSGAYFGNFSNQSKTSSNDYKGANYGSISSESYKYAPQPGSKGMSFGESVMKELYEKKKPAPAVQTPQPQPQPSSGLNIQTMIQKKTEKKVESPTKKSFNSLNMKLVKPPQKKLVGNPSQKPPIKPESVQKVSKKEENKIDIMDFDFGAATTGTTGTTAQTNELDFLGTTPQPQTASNSFNMFQATGPQHSEKVAPNNNLMGLDSFNIQSSPPTNIQPSSTTISNPVGTYFQSSSQPQVQSNLNWGFNSSAQVPNQQVKLSLEVKPEVKSVGKDEGSLIDFSNFRQELESLDPKGKDENITSNWNW